MSRPANILTKLSLTACALLLSACGQLQQWQYSADQRLSQLLAQHEYQQALELIDTTDKTNPDYQALSQQRASILKQQQSYISQQISSSRQLRKQQQWPKALAVLNDALTKNPKNEKLQNAISNTKREQTDFIAQQKIAIAKVSAQHYLQSNLLLEGLLKASPKQTHYQQQQDFAQQHKALHFTTLQQAAEQAIANKQWRSAQDLLKHAHYLDSNSTTKALQQQVAQALQHNQQRQKSQAINQQRLSNLRLSQNLAAQINAGQWLQAQQTANTLAAQPHLSGADKQHISSSLKRLSSHISALIKQGQQAYTKGDISDAIGYWQQALELQPDNGNLHQRLERASRFLNNLNKLP